LQRRARFGPVTIGMVSEDAPVKGRIAAWEDRHRVVVVRGSLVALLLIAVVLFLVLRGGAGRQTCALYAHSSKTYLVIRGPGSSKEARRVCTLLANRLSRAGGERFSVSTGSKYSGEVRVCAFHGNSAEADIYAKRPDAQARRLCQAVKSGGIGPVT
jgi:hypothetical protein